MYINAKMIPVETVRGIRGGERGWRSAVEGINLGMIYLIHSKNLCQCYNIPPSGTTILKK
jgi:hypothetical protein